MCSADSTKRSVPAVVTTRQTHRLPRRWQLGIEHHGQDKCGEPPTNTVRRCPDKVPKMPHYSRAPSAPSFSSTHSHAPLAKPAFTVVTLILFRALFIWSRETRCFRRLDRLSRLSAATGIQQVLPEPLPRLLPFGLLIAGNRRLVEQFGDALRCCGVGTLFARSQVAVGMVLGADAPAICIGFAAGGVRPGLSSFDGGIEELLGSAGAPAGPASPPAPRWPPTGPPPASTTQRSAHPEQRSARPAARADSPGGQEARSTPHATSPPERARPDQTTAATADQHTGRAPSGIDYPVSLGKPPRPTEPPTPPRSPASIHSHVPHRRRRPATPRPSTARPPTPPPPATAKSGAAHRTSSHTE